MHTDRSELARTVCVVAGQSTCNKGNTHRVHNYNKCTASTIQERERNIH